MNELARLRKDLRRHQAVVDPTIDVDELTRDANIGTLRRLCAKERERLRVLEAQER